MPEGKSIHAALFAASIATLAFLSHAHASSLAVEFTPVTPVKAVQNISAGWAFTTNQSITVSALDAFDVAPAGSQVRLYDALGTIVASATITTTDGVVGSPVPFYSQSISPVTLNSFQNYYIAEDLIANTVNIDINANAGFAPAPSITYRYSVDDATGLGKNPTAPIGIQHGIFGPNFELTPTPNAPTVVYTQLSNQDEALASQTGITAYDDFKLTADTTVTNVTWQGAFYNGAPTTIPSFTIAFYANNINNQPGALLTTETITGNANETLVGHDSDGNPLYNYTTALPTSFTATANTSYWLSIVANFSAAPNWGWESSGTGNGFSFQNSGPSNFVNETDLAFQLSFDPNAAVPEPASLSLLALSASTLLLRRRPKPPYKSTASK